MDTDTTNTAKPDLARIRKRIRDRERRFKQATPAGKRVMIARDVIKQLDSKRLIARGGCWVSYRGKPYTLDDESGEKDFREVLLSVPQCSACALGSLLVCTVERANKAKMNDFMQDGSFDPGFSNIAQYLEPYFSIEQLNMIENAFERRCTHWSWEVSDEKLEASVRFGTDVTYGVKTDDQDATVLHAIMSNIVRNKGEFVP